MGAKKDHNDTEMADMDVQKELAGCHERNRLHRVMRNGAWLSSIPHCLDVTEIFWEELRDNICLRYGLMPQDNNNNNNNNLEN